MKAPRNIIRPLNGTQFVPFTDDEVEDIEAVFCCSIPLAIKKIWKTLGGFSFIDSVSIAFPVRFPPKLSCPITEVSFFYASTFDTVYDRRKLSAAIQGAKDVIGEGVLPFAETDASDLIVLSLKKDHFGEVYLWDRTEEELDENESDDDNQEISFFPAPTFYFLDSTFESFESCLSIQYKI